MPRDRLRVLLAIRQLAVDQAMQALATCIAAEQEASGRLAALDAEAAAERAAIASTDDQAPDLEAFARWAAWARTRRRDAAAALLRAESQTAPARVALAEARAAARAVEELITLREAEARSREGALEARALDDISAQRHRHRRNPFSLT